MANHLKALLKKNWILWKRNLCCSCCELLLPTLLIFALIGLRSAVDKTQLDDISYVNQGILNGGPTILYPKLINPMSSDQKLKLF
jgi:ATP-binding cassette subfamily A (ABC1) protein 3